MTSPRARRSRTPDPQQQGVGRDVLEARVAVLEASVSRQGNVTTEMLDAWRPGGKENPDTAATGLLTYLCQLHRWHATGPEMPTSSKQALRWDASAVNDVRAALSAEPIHLTLESGRKVAVSPKSQVALYRIALIDKALQWTVERRVALEMVEPDAETLNTLHLALETQARLEREFVEIICHPGPGLPWPESGVWDTPLQDWSADISPLDLLLLRKAHLDVNVLRLHAIADRTKSLAESDGDESMPLAAFLGVMSSDLGVQPRELASKWSLGEVFAQALLKWESHERAMRQAEADAEARKEKKG